LVDGVCQVYRIAAFGSSYSDPIKKPITD